MRKINQEIRWGSRMGLAALMFLACTVLILTLSAPGAWATPAQSRIRDTVPPPDAIAGRVFEDQNRNGWPDSGESGIADVLLTLSGTFTTTTYTTSAGGTYWFRNLSGGETYTVTETDPEGYLSSTPNQVTVTVPITGPGVEVNFGDYQHRVFLPLILRAL